MHPRSAVKHPNIYFDTLVHDVDSFDLMVKRSGVDQIFVGLDDPYPLGEMESEPQSSYPGKLLDLCLERGLINKAQHTAMWSKNVLNWLGEDLGNDVKKRVQNSSIQARTASE